MDRSRACLVLAVLTLTLLVWPTATVAQGTVRPTLRPVTLFPLEVGTYWVYERRGATGTSTWRVEVVADSATAPAQPARGLSGYFPGPARQVRVWPLDVVTEVDPGGHRDSLWYLLRAPAGMSWTLELAATQPPVVGLDCIDGAKLHVARRDESLTVPAGEFTKVVRVDFATRCVDAGITAEFFAPGVGLIRRDETSIAGPVISELVETNAGGLRPVSLPYTTSLGLDRPQVFNDLMPSPDPWSPPVLTGAVSVRNDTAVPTTLTFSGCASATIEVHDEKGELVLTSRADDGGCCTCDSLLPVTLARRALTLPISLRLRKADGTPLATGFYALTATFNTVDPPALRPRATARLEVQAAY